MADSYLVGCAQMGMDIRIAAPGKLQPHAVVVEQARTIAAETGARVTITEDVVEGVRDCDAVATDVWVSMGEPDAVWAERIALLRPYQVDRALLDLTGNPDVKFLHCLPAFHNSQTSVGKDIRERYGLDALEVTDEVFESTASVVFDEAENRLHTIKAILVATLEN
jgi:ornithine carbamoyltransferase